MGVAKEGDKQKKKKEHQEKDEKLHDALEDSFPASDPLPMSQPRHKNGPPKDKKSCMYRKPHPIEGESESRS